MLHISCSFYTALGDLISLGVIKNSPLMQTSDGRSTTFHQSLLFLVICDLLFLVMTLTDEYVDPDSATYIIIFPYFW